MQKPNKIYQGTYNSGYGRGTFVLSIHGSTAELEWDHDEKSGTAELILAMRNKTNKS